ncbi:MAG: hypothetical protein J5976_03785 [Bacteroidales bacterium]|nr:hypothetical protein [Bacteroidales bacterium]
MEINGTFNDMKISRIPAFKNEGWIFNCSYILEDVDDCIISIAHNDLLVPEIGINEVIDDVQQIVSV